jgi:LCP family protein required for cell wall assembly
MRREHSKKSHTVRNTILIVLAVILLGGGIFGFKKYQNIKNAVDNTYSSAGIKKQRNTNSLINSKKPISILLMGTDTGALGRSYKGRTDSMMVVTINPKTKKTTITSIPRDLGVTIPGYESKSPSKINAAYAFGQAGTAIRTVQAVFNIPIDFYVLVNMGGMEKVVDEAGGVDITPTLSFTYQGYTFTKGVKTHMDGKKALAYSRMRYDDPQNDYGRQTRQRAVLTAIISKSSSISTLLNKDFIDSISNETQTDFKFDDLVDLAKNYRSATGNIEETHAQGSGQTVNGQSMEIVSKTELQRVTDFIRSGLSLSQEETGSAALSANSTSTNTSDSSVEQANINAGN